MGDVPQDDFPGPAPAAAQDPLKVPAWDAPDGKEPGLLDQVGNAATMFAHGMSEGPLGRAVMNSLVVPSAAEEFPGRVAQARAESPGIAPVAEFAGGFASPEAGLSYPGGQLLKAALGAKAAGAAAKQLAKDIPGFTVKAANAGAARMKWTQNVLLKALGARQAATDAAPALATGAGALAGKAVGGYGGAALGAMLGGGSASGAGKSLVSAATSPAIQNQIAHLLPYLTTLGAHPEDPIGMQRAGGAVAEGAGNVARYSIPELLRRPKENQ